MKPPAASFRFTVYALVGNARWGAQVDVRLHCRRRLLLKRQRIIVDAMAGWALRFNMETPRN